MCTMHMSMHGGSYLDSDEELSILVVLSSVPGNTRSAIAPEGYVLTRVLHRHETDVVVRPRHGLQVTELPTFALCVCVCVCVTVCVSMGGGDW